MVSIPPIPEPKLTPALVRSVEESKKPESVIACEAATIPYWINVSNLRDSLGSRYKDKSKSLMRPPIETGESTIVLLKEEIPEIPLVQASHEEPTSLPKGETKPKPVTTTLLCSFMEIIYELAFM